MHTPRQDVVVAEAPPAQVHPFAPVCKPFLLHIYIPIFVQDVQDNRDGVYRDGAHSLAVGPPEAFPGVWPPSHPEPPANIPLANGLRILASRFLNNPDTLVNTLRIEPGPDGRFEVWIALELADLF